VKEMNLQWKRARGFIFVAQLVLWFQPAMVQTAIAQAAPGSEDDDTASQQFGGPGSVSGQLADDARLTESLTGITILPDHLDWKASVSKDRGLTFSLDYSAAFLSASNTLREDDNFGGGIVRFFGTWELVESDSGNRGGLVWKIEHRHRYTGIPPSGAASEIGYAGSILSPFSDDGFRLSNLYWQQNLNENHVEIIAGMIDTADWVDLYALGSKFTGFFNTVFGVGGGSMVLPDSAALGVYVNAMMTDNLYFIAGLADGNADSTDPFNGIDSFFNDREYVKSIELGWTTSRDRFYLDNTHLTYWHADERIKAGVSGGWGINFSFENTFDDKWMPFVRAGYANDGGTFLQKTFSTGLGHHFKDNASLLGLGFNWGQPNEDTYGLGLDDQYTVELFSRLQIMHNFQLTPDIQYIRNPALNPGADQSWVLGLRGRMIF